MITKSYNKDYDDFFAVFLTLRRIANNGLAVFGEVTLSSQEAQSLCEGIEDLHRVGETIVRIYDVYFEGEPLQQAVENLAHVIDRTGGESR